MTCTSAPRWKSLLLLATLAAAIMTACTHSTRHTGRYQTIMEDSLAEDKRLVLDSLKNEFKSQVFTCLAQSGLEPDCGDHDAGGFAITFVTDIDSQGHVSHCTISGEDICGADRQKIREINKCLIAGMSAIIFPAPLRDMKLSHTVQRYVRS